MVQLDINPNQGKEGILSAKSGVPKLKAPIKINSVLALSIFVVALFVGAAFLIFAVNQIQKSRIKSTSNDISNKEQELARLDETRKKAESLYIQVKYLESLWANRDIWSSIFTEIAKTTTKNTKIEMLSLDKDNKLVLNGQTVSLSSLAKFITSLENNKNFTDIQLTNTALDSGVVKFGIKFSSPLIQGAGQGASTAPEPAASEGV